MSSEFGLPTRSSTGPGRLVASSPSSLAGPPDPPPDLRSFVERLATLSLDDRYNFDRPSRSSSRDRASPLPTPPRRASPLPTPPRRAEPINPNNGGTANQQQVAASEPRPGSPVASSSACRHRTRWDYVGGRQDCVRCGRSVGGVLECSRCDLRVCSRCQKQILPKHSHEKKYGLRPGQPGYGQRPV